MTDAAPAAAVTAAPAKKKATGAKTKAPANHPKYAEMVISAITALKERGGSSRQAIAKYIIAHFDVGKDEKVVNTHLRLALKRMVASQHLSQPKGKGAAGSFRVGEKKVVEKKVTKPKSPKPKKVTKTKVAKAKKAAPAVKTGEGDAAAAAPAAPKSPVKKAVKPKAVKKASPKKVKAPGSPKKPKVAKTATAKSKAAKPKAVKKTAAKKPAAPAAVKA